MRQDETHAEAIRLGLVVISQHPSELPAYIATLARRDGQLAHFVAQALSDVASVKLRKAA